MRPHADSSDWLLAEEYRASGAVSNEDSSIEEKFGLFVTFAFTVNMAMGAGIVGLPFAFYHAGAIFSLVCLVIATLMAITTMGYIVEVSGWCEGWVSADEAERNSGMQCGSPQTAELKRRPVTEEWFKISPKRKFELSELCGVFLGIKIPDNHWLRGIADCNGEIHLARKVLELSVICYTFGSCWLDGTVFASSLSLIVPVPLPSRPAGADCLLSSCAERTAAACTGSCAWANTSCAPDRAAVIYCDQSYLVCLAAFAAAMVGMACTDVSVLKRAQLALSGLALLALVAMVATCAVAAARNDGPDGAWGALPPTDLAGAGKLVSTALFSQLAHQVLYCKYSTR